VLAAGSVQWERWLVRPRWEWIKPAYVALMIVGGAELHPVAVLPQHRVEVLYQTLNNVQLGFTGFLGRPLNFGNATPPEDILQRYQFDVIYKF
jgi:hypothetical protein